MRKQIGVVVLVLAMALLATGAVTLINLTSQVTGVLPKANGGAGADMSSVTFPSSGTLVINTGVVDFGSATSLKVPAAAGASPTASGLIAYDTTSNTLEAGVNGANKTVMMTDTAVQAAQMPALTGDTTSSAGAVATTLAAKYKTISCQPGLGDGLNAVTAGTYLQSACYNDSGVTWTITGIKCFTDNSGSSTLASTNGAGTALQTGAVTCTSSFAAATQSGTTTIASGDFIKFTWVADGTSKQSTWVVTITK